MKVLPVTYISQYNTAIKSSVAPGARCAYTAGAMTLSLEIPEAINDAWIESFIYRIEHGDICQEILARPDFKKRLPRMGAHGEVIAYAAEIILRDYGSSKKVIWHAQNAPDGTIEKAIDGGSPVCLSTMLTKSGHFINIATYDDNFFYAKDPAGNAVTGYRNRNGDLVPYKKTWLKPKCQSAFPAWRLWYLK
jgi:hypothetical protein